MTKTIVGLGVLTLSSGLASGTGTGPATLAMAATTALGAYTWSLIGEVCEFHVAHGVQCTLHDLWRASIGSSSLWIVQGATVSLCYCLCTVYLLCLGEILPPLLGLAGVPSIVRSRRASILLGAAAVLPLCLQPTLTSLNFASVLGSLAIGCTCVFLMTRWLDGSYARGGRFFDRMPPQLQADVERAPKTWEVSKETSILIANLGTSLCAHYLAPNFYRTLASASAARFRLVTFMAFTIVFVISLLHALPGFFTFGRACQPLILNNFHPTDDVKATGARVAVAASLICSFPFIFMGLREALLPSLDGLFSGLRPHLIAIPHASWYLVTLIVGAPVLGTALLVDNLGLIVGLMGSVLGGALMYVTPAAMHASYLVGREAILSGWGATVAAASTLSPTRRLALAGDVALLVYGLIGQMLIGTTVIYEYARKQLAKSRPTDA